MKGTLVEQHRCWLSKHSWLTSFLVKKEQNLFCLSLPCLLPQSVMWQMLNIYRSNQKVSSHCPSDPLTLWLKMAPLVETQNHWHEKQSLRTSLKDERKRQPHLCEFIFIVLMHLWNNKLPYPLLTQNRILCTSHCETGAKQIKDYLHFESIKSQTILVLFCRGLCLKGYCFGHVQLHCST